MTAGDNNEHTFDQALSYFHIISGVLGGKEAGTYLASALGRGNVNVTFEINKTDN